MKPAEIIKALELLDPTKDVVIGIPVDDGAVYYRPLDHVRHGEKPVLMVRDPRPGERV